MKKLAIFLLLSFLTLVSPLSAYAATVMIDPGHGGSDPGAIGVTGLYEKEVNLAISLMVREELANKGYRVLMTRDQDVALSLQERIDIANEAMPDILVSIHANSFRSPDVSGTLVLYYDNRYPLASYPASEAMARLTPQSRALAQSILEEAVKATGMTNRGLMESSVYMVRMGSFPSALIETAFLSNREDEKKLRDEQFRLKMAKGIANGIAKYLPVLFSDTVGHWARESIVHLHKLGIVNGNGEYFFPNRPLTRAEFIAMMDRSGLLSNAEKGNEQKGEDEEWEGCEQLEGKKDQQQKRQVNEEDRNCEEAIETDRYPSKDDKDEQQFEQSEPLRSDHKSDEKRKTEDESSEEREDDTDVILEDQRDSRTDDVRVSAIEDHHQNSLGKDRKRRQNENIAANEQSQEEEKGLNDQNIEHPFSDLSEAHWAYESMLKAVKHEVIEGFPDGTLRPDEPITRGQVSVMLDRLMSKRTDKDERQATSNESKRNPSSNQINHSTLRQSFSFHDVPKQMWYAESIYRLYERNILLGVGANKFAPERLMSRGEAAALIDRLLSKPVLF